MNSLMALLLTLGLAQDPMWEGKHADSREWSRETLIAVLESDLPNIIPDDVNQWCPRYKNLTKYDRAWVWVHVVSAIAWRESDFRPHVSYRECSKSKSTYGSRGVWNKSLKQWCLPGSKQDGGVAISRGLMQLSLSSANAYGCGFSSSQELHDGVLNLKCGVIILERWVVADRVLRGGKTGSWRGGSRYWAVLRNVFEPSKRIDGYLKNLSLCQ